MSTTGDELEVSSHALNDLLADLNHPSTSSSSNQHPSSTIPTWGSSYHSNSARASPNSSTPLPEGPAVRPSFPHRSSSREYSRQPTTDLDVASTSGSTHQNTLFNTPSRSIFSSGPPTSSISAKTAQASMSAPSPVNPTLPLSALTVPSSSSSRRSVHYPSDTQSPSSRKSRIHSSAEKDVDDPSTTLEESRSAERRDASTPTALSRLFATPEAPTPVVSRNASYARNASGAGYTRCESYCPLQHPLLMSRLLVNSSETAPLPNHLYNKGLLSGRHSDITIHAFGAKYALHRLLLDRAPFFSSALSEPWYESTLKEITLHPEDIDSNITQSAFELALKRIYGCNYSPEDDKEAIGLFATGCWLEMADLVDASVNSLLRQMSPAKLAPLIRLVTNNYYGKHGERILASAKAMLCRNGWEMPLRYWDGVPGDIIREIIGGDGFYIHDEWERWYLSKRVLDRKLKMCAQELGLVDSNGKPKQPPPDTMGFFAIRFDTVYRKQGIAATPRTSEACDPWLAVYTSPDIAAILVLLDEGIHYVHMSFEQLQKIREQRDIFGVTVMPEEVIHNALWMSMELRQKIVNARELDMELGLSQPAEERSDIASNSSNVAAETSTGGTGKGKAVEIKGETGAESQKAREDEMESDSWDGNGKPRKFWIPHVDSTTVYGGNPEIISTAAASMRPIVTRHISRLSATIDPADVQWASDFGSVAHDRPQSPNATLTAEPVPPVSYTHYPPFRFSAEFKDSTRLQLRKRVYSRTVWYAGSLWNVYVQKVETAKNTQLGVYLHRAKEKEGSDEVLAASGNTVDERIGHLEREMIMRRNERRSQRTQQKGARAEADEEGSGSSGDPDATLVPGSSTDRSRPGALNGLLRGQGVMKASQTPGSLTLSNLPDRKYGAGTPDTDEENDDPVQPSKRVRVPAMPPYIDGRPTIKTYFKIYTPSKGGRILSVYESAPDKFNFSQSWGWKSSNMILDDGILGCEESTRSRDGKLRFMVVIGNTFALLISLR